VQAPLPAPPPVSPPRNNPTRKRPSAAATALLTALAVLALDQATKALLAPWLSVRPSVPVLPGFFHLTLVHNTGVAFGLFQGYGLWVTLATLAVLAAVARSSLRRGQGTLVVLCLGLIIGGALGNLADRLRLGAVVDFLDVRFFDVRFWPVFNVADSCVTVGAILLALGIWRRR